MASKKSINAAELMRQLNSDKDFKTRQKRKQVEEKQRQKNRLNFEAPIINDLQKSGLEISSISDLMGVKKQLSDSVILTLGSWIDKIDNEYNILETIIRGLTGQEIIFNYKILTSVYERIDSSEHLKFAIANCIAESKVYGIDDWLKNKIDQSDEVLLLAASRYLPAKEVIPYLKKSFNKNNDFVYQALGEIGGESELEFMKMNQSKFRGHAKKSIESAIKNIEKNLH